MKNNLILVTGGGGYIGSVLVPFLLKKKFKVIVVDRFFFGDFLPKRNKNLKIIKLDVRYLNKKNFKKVDTVIDLVGISNDPAGEYFKKETKLINYKSRVRNAKLARSCGVKKYLLPSSCSIYGFQKKIVNEASKVNPLTEYAKSNYNAEKEILKIATSDFCVSIIRQATVFGFSPRMRFDLAVNGMTEGAVKNNILPLMRNGSQIRPLVHVKDVARCMLFMINKKKESINKQIFNLGSKQCTLSVKNIGFAVRKSVGQKVKIKWYGDPDNRSYNVSFNKIEELGFKAIYDIAYGVKEIKYEMQKNNLKKDTKTLTLDWYKFLEESNLIISKVSVKNKILKGL